jgi:DNA-binding response OmpR family regulator
MNNDTRDVLIVEDEKHMQRLLSHLLERAGFNVTLASSGVQAKQILDARVFDLICSDVMMSGIDGLQLCSWVKEQDRLSQIPFVILSSRAQPGDKERGMSAGADAYLTKPFEIHQLMRTLDAVISSHSNR